MSDVMSKNARARNAHHTIYDSVTLPFAALAVNSVPDVRVLGELVVMSIFAPENVQVQSVGRNAFDVSWERPNDEEGEAPVSYSFGVFVKEVREKEFKMVYQTRDDDFTFRCVDLTPATEYEIFVQSFGIMSEGDKSITHKVVTPASAPTHAPKQLTVLDVGRTEVMLQWAPPNTEGGDVTGYRLYYDQEGSDEFTEVEVPPTQCTYNASGLAPGAVYRFQVVAYNPGGDSPETPTLRFKLADGKASPVKPRIGAGDAGVISRRKASLAEGAGGGGADAAAVAATTVVTEPGQQMGSIGAAVTGTGMHYASPTTVAEGAKVVVASPPNTAAALLAAAAEKEKAVKLRPKKAVVDRSGYVEPQPEVNRGSWMVVSRKQTIRGKKNGVRKVKATLMKQSSEAQVELTPLQRTIEEERTTNRLVLYTTSTAAIRETYSRCQRLMAIMYNLRIRVYNKDISMDKTYIGELNERMPGAVVPQLFAGGEHIGGYDELFKMNERGEFKGRLGAFICDDSPMQDCGACAGSGFIMCSWCDGTRRSGAIASAFSTGNDTNKGFLKCTVCNENGLERCREC